MLYPFKFKTIFKDKIWGGNKIHTILNKDFAPLPNCGETWEISGVKGDVSVVANGELAGEPLTQLLNEYRDLLVGKKVYQRFGNEFPLLIKFIDANDDLSIQVHPDDTLAKARHNSFGKTEMWYVVQADQGASLITGFNQPVSREIYLNHFGNNTLNDILNKENVQADDTFFIPAGRVHTIGKGLVIAEIQQTSDITYRIYDFDRTDDKGNKRELHTEEALDAIDYNYYDSYKTSYNQAKNHTVELASCPYFTTNRLFYENQSIERNHENLDSFVIYICLDGQAKLQYDGGSMTISKGDSVLLPAMIKKIRLEAEPQFKILETYIS